MVKGLIEGLYCQWNLFNLTLFGLILYIKHFFAKRVVFVGLCALLFYFSFHEFTLWTCHVLDKCDEVAQKVNCIGNVVEMICDILAHVVTLVLQGRICPFNIWLFDIKAYYESVVSVL